MAKTIKEIAFSDGRVYRNGVVFVAGVVTGTLHVGANGLRWVGVSDSKTMKQTFHDAYVKPQAWIDYLKQDDVVVLTDDELEQCRQDAIDDTGVDSGPQYDLAYEGNIQSLIAAKS